MNSAAIALRVSDRLGRTITTRFVEAVLYGDQFVYERVADEDPEAARLVLALARGRLG